MIEYRSMENIVEGSPPIYHHVPKDQSDTWRPVQYLTWEIRIFVEVGGKSTVGSHLNS